MSEDKENIISKYEDKKNIFLFYFQSALAIGSVLVFFTFVDVYFYDIGKIPPPVTLVTLFLIGGFLLLVFSRFAILKYIPVELIIWCGGYLVISLLSFILVLCLYADHAFASESFQEVRTRILSELFLLITCLIYSKYPKIQYLTRIAICLATLLAVFNNIREVGDPLAFEGLNNTGRAAGYYINPNRTGCALILGMIFGIGVLPKQLRIPFALLVIFGVFLTFSRGAILGWFMLVVIFVQSGVIPRKNFLLWVVGMVMAVVVMGPILSNIDVNELQRSGVINIGMENITGRLEWFQNPLANREDSGDSRLEVVMVAWNMFLEHPIVGNGIASTKNLNNLGISTHNMYLLFATEHGIMGVFILPLLVYVVTWHSRGESKHIASAFSAFILLWGLFSHNIVDERYILMCFSLMAAMNLTSRLEQKI